MSDKKWFPNNKLYEEYNISINCLAELERLKYCLNEYYIPKSKKLFKEYHLTKNTQIKNELILIEENIKSTKETICKLKMIDYNIIDKWNNYLELATNFLKNNNLQNDINVNDILTDISLYLLNDKYLKEHSNDTILHIFFEIKTFNDLNIFTIIKNSIHTFLQNVIYNNNINNEPFEITDDNLTEFIC
jgi:hypothetical protein